MMLQKYTQAVVFVLVSLLMSHVVFAKPFKPVDFEGTWYAHKVVSGDNPPAQPRWGYGEITFDSVGNFSVSGWNSSGSVPVNSTGAIEISSCGIITIASEPLLHGIMNEARNLIVFTDGNSNGNGITIMVKRTSGTSFSTGNLSGSWYGLHVVTGDVATGDDPRWGYGAVTINGSGNYIATWTSPTQVNEISSGTVQIDSNGILQMNNDPLTHGVMSDDKKQFVFIDGSSTSDGNILSVFFKRDPGISFNTGNLEGLWCGHHVVSGDDPPDDPRWGYGTATITDSGSYTATWTSPTQTDEISQGTIQINGTGVIGLNNEPLVHGVMSDDKNQLMFIDGSPTSSGNALALFTRCSPCKIPSGVLHLLLLERAR